MSRLGLIGGGIGLLAIAALSFWVYALRADNAALKTTLEARDGTIQRQNGIIGTQALQLSLKDLEVELGEKQRAADDAARREEQTVAEDLQKPLKRGTPADASPAFDPVAGPVLIAAAGDLRLFGEKVAALRAAAAGEAAGVPAVPRPGGAAADPWPRLKPGFRESEFRDVCFQIGNAFAKAAGKIRGIDLNLTTQNKNVDQMNAAAAALAGVK